MLRTALFAAAVVGTVVLSAPAAEPDLSGNWLLSYTARGGANEVNYCILKIETKDGKPTASVVAVPGKALVPTVKGFKADGNEITVTLSSGPVFAGVVGTDAKLIRGGFGTETIQYRGKLTRTDKDAIESSLTKGAPVEPMTKAQQLAGRPTLLRFQAAREKDAGKKKELLAQLEEAQEADAKVPGLYREVVEKHADHPAAMDAALALIQGAVKLKVTPDEARKLVALVQKEAAPYGSKYLRFVTVEAAEQLASQKGFGAAALAALRPVVKGLTDTEPAAAQVRVLTAYKAALEASGDTAEAKTIAGLLEKLEVRLDQEYLAAVPPFKPVAFDGRKDKAANRVAVMELFTGAQCPPCVAADVGFDALARSYKATDLVLIQYHMHIPGPDPMTNPDTVARWDYYREAFPAGIRGTPSTLFNGKPAAGGGGGMANVEGKYQQYRGIIDPLLEATTTLKLTGKAVRRGDAVEVAVEVDGAPAEDDLKLRVLLVEDTVKYVGGNKLRFHHHVVRAMPGGAGGVAVKDKAMTHTVTADVGTVRKDLVKYLDDFAANERPFPTAARPLDMTGLKVIALMQSDKTREILQAVQLDVVGKPAGGN